MPLLARLAVVLASVAVVAPASAQESRVFDRVATFPVTANAPAGEKPEQETAAEIISATPDGMLLVYTDSPGKRIGFIDIADPAAPKPAGLLAMDGEPTSVKIVGAKALVAVNTSESKAAPSGRLAVVDIASRKIEATCDLAGQPDSVAASKDGRTLAIAIENERDEEKDKGRLPQLPAGALALVGLSETGAADCASLRIVAMTGLSETAGDDPEPEFVDVNGLGEVVATLQENNHIAVVDTASGQISAHFSAGAVSLEKIDAKRDGIITPTDSQPDRKREPDAVRWLDDERFVTANEGDYDGGSRGFTIFAKDGNALFDSGNALEHLAIRLGHYPDRRSSAKGAEPEGIEVGDFDGEKLIFVGLERASLVAVYRDKGGAAAPEYVQALPGGIGPEGLLAIPARGLFVTASETDLRKDKGAGSMVTVYARKSGAPAYPQIVSDDGPIGAPIGWGALSGAAADAKTPGLLFVVTDGAYAEARVLTLDAAKTPARITAAITVTEDGQSAKNLDLEGIAARAEGGFWLASEGDPEKKKTQSTLLRIDPKGAVQETVALPEGLAAQATASGFEGVAVTGSGADETVWLAVQREWKDDPKGFVKLLAYAPATKQWRQARYPLDKAADGLWVGLSELVSLGNDAFLAIERDNGVGEAAKVKKLTRVSTFGVTLAPLDGGGPIPVLPKTTVRDLLPDLKAAKGYVFDKVESVAVDPAGDVFAITDNDGVDGSSGETQLLRLGKALAKK